MIDKIRDSAPITGTNKAVANIAFLGRAQPDESWKPIPFLEVPEFIRDQDVVGNLMKDPGLCAMDPNTGMEYLVVDVDEFEKAAGKAGVEGTTLTIGGAGVVVLDPARPIEWVGDAGEEGGDG